MKKVQEIYTMYNVESVLNHNFSTLDEMITEHRLCIRSLNELVEQQATIIDGLSNDTQTHFDAMAHQKVAIDDLQSQINDLTRNLLEVTRAMTTFVQTTDTRIKDVSKVSQFYKDKSNNWK